MTTRGPTSLLAGARPPPLPQPTKLGAPVSTLLRTSSTQPMEVQNAQLLESQQALKTLASKPLSGVHSLRLREVLEQVEARLARIQEVQQDLTSRDDMDEEEAQEEWQMVLEDTLEIDHDPLPESAVRGVQIAAGDLMTLDWLIRDEEEDEEDGQG